jgi:hypothetical protein
VPHGAVLNVAGVVEVEDRDTVGANRQVRLALRHREDLPVELNGPDRIFQEFDGDPIPLSTKLPKKLFHNAPP